MILRSPAENENGGISFHMVPFSTRHSRARGNPGLLRRISLDTRFRGYDGTQAGLLVLIPKRVFSKEGTKPALSRVEGSTKFIIINRRALRVLRTTIHDNFRGLRKFSGRRRPLEFGYASRQDAKFGNRFLFFAPFAFFAGDIPRPTGARSAPYETLRVLRELRGESDFSHFGCGCAAL